MQLELKNTEGKSIGTFEFPVEEVAKSLSQSLSSSLESDAQLHEAELKGSREKVGELEEKLAKAEGKTMADYSPDEKANFVINWLKGLPPEETAVFAEAVGIPIAKAPEAEVAEAEAKQKAEVEEAAEPKVIRGKVDRPGWRYLQYVDYSVKE